MTFVVTEKEWLEGIRIHARSQNRFLPLMPYFSGALAALFLFFQLINPDWLGAILTAFFVWCFLDVAFLASLRLRRMFRRYCPTGVTAPVTYQFSPDGFVVVADGEFPVRWNTISQRLEGPDVWVFVSIVAPPSFWKAAPPQLLIIPKHATQSEEGKREWAIVDAYFAPPSTSPPIASP